MTAFCRQTIQKTRDRVKELGHKLLASDTDSVTYQINDSIRTGADIVEHVNDINKWLSTEIGKEMVVELEEVITPSKPGYGCVYNYGLKSYMFSYAKKVGDDFIFADGKVWERGVYGECYQKQRGFVTGQFSKEVQARLQNHLLTLYDPSV